MECARCVCVWLRSAWEEKGVRVSRGLGPGSGGVVWRLCELRVQILCVDGRSRYLYIVIWQISQIQTCV